MIPRTIVQFWHDRKPPAEVRKLAESWRRWHPEYSYELCSDENAETLMALHFGANGVRAYRKCRVPAMRSDLFRYAYLLLHGGTYVDIDERCTGRLPLHFDQYKHTILFRKTNTLLSNSFMLSEPQALIYRKILATAIEKILAEKGTDIYAITGPLALTRAYRSMSPDEQVAITIQPIDRSSRVTRIVEGLEYKNGGHWTEQQKDGLYLAS